MPWMPEVFNAPIAEARRAQEEVAPTNDAVPYYEGIMADEPDALVRSFAGEPAMDDPRFGWVEGAKGLQYFVSKMADWLRERDAVVKNVALTRTQARTVAEPKPPTPPVTIAEALVRSIRTPNRLFLEAGALRCSRRSEPGG